MGEKVHEKTKSLVLKISGNRVSHPAAQEGLRCARGLVADGRWKVIVELSEEGVMSLNERSRGLHAPDASSVEQLAARAQIIVVMKHTDQGSFIPEWMLKVTPDEALRLGIKADVVLLF